MSNMNLPFEYGARGLKGLAALGEIEAARRNAKAKQQALESGWQGESLGVLAGSLARAGQDGYDRRKAQHEKANPGQDYAFLDDMESMFKGWF